MKTITVVVRHGSVVYDWRGDAWLYSKDDKCWHPIMASGRPNLMIGCKTKRLEAEYGPLFSFHYEEEW